MRVPYGWLTELVDGLPAVGELTSLLDGLGLAVETVHSYPGAAKGTVAVRIERIEPIAESDHLVTAEAFDGNRRVVVVTGAPNARAGMTTAFAPAGTALPGAERPVERRVVAGVQSDGMLLSPRELGVFDYGGGLIELPAELEPGADLALLWPGDDVLELELTPNRADAFSVLGVARDVAAKLATRVHDPAAGAPDGDETVDDGLAIEVSEAEACPSFTLRRIDGVTVGPSPIWLQRRLATVGVRPRNNVVDVTNLVTFELGQPSHAYDAEALHQGTVQVRRARPGEQLLTLNGDELKLAPDDLVIATPRGGDTAAIGLAGVIGGLQDSVDDGTSSVALEVAHFQPLTVRRTAKRHGLATDAHYRFERGVDPGLPPRASARAAQLIAELTGGKAHPGVTSFGKAPAATVIGFRPSRVAYLMDFEVDPSQQRRYLKALGCEVSERAPDDWLVTAPTWRFDLAIEEDLVEEVARLHGYEHVGETVPAMRFVPPLTDPTHRALRLELAGAGFQEAIGYVFTSAAELERAAAPEPRVRLKNPQGAERSVLRTALYPGLLAAAALNRQVPSLALFEVGRVFLEEETERVALLARGRWIEAGWREGLELDFFLFKGLLERLAAGRNAELELRPAIVPYLHPGVSAEVRWNGRAVGSAGRLHPATTGRFDLGEVYVAELELPLEARGVRYRDIARQPHAERDLAVVAPVDVPYARLRELVAATAGEHLESVEPFDIYTGAQVSEGRRSVALRLRFRHAMRALRDDEVDERMQNVIGAVRAAGYDIRDQ